MQFLLQNIIVQVGNSGKNILFIFCQFHLVQLFDRPKTADSKDVQPVDISRQHTYCTTVVQYVCLLPSFKMC